MSQTVFVFAMFALVLCLGTVAPAAEFYIAPTGSDANPGTKAKPFTTLERARDAIREARRSGAPAEGGFTVYLGAGDYRLAKTFALTAEDSGTAASPLVFRAAEGQAVRILGGKLVGPFRPVQDKDVLARLDEAARPHVVQADLKAMGITDFGTLRSRGFGRPSSPAHMELFVGGRPMTLARYPNEGFAKIVGGPAGAVGPDDHGGKLGDLQAGFTYEGDRPSKWKEPFEARVHGYWAYDWANSYERIAAIDTAARLIKTAKPFGHYGFRTGQRILFLNILEELDSPGEYYVDGKAGILYFYPPSDAAAGEAMVSVLEGPLISMKDVSYVTIRGPGLTLECTRGHGVEVSGGSDCTVAGLTLRNIGQWAVRCEGGNRHQVISCNVSQTGDGGVSTSGGNRKTLTPCGHVVSNCVFHDIGRWTKCYVPAVSLSGVGIRVANNLIHDHPHAGILFGGNDHVIELNEIHHVAMETGDVGAIYGGRDWTMQGNTIRHNYIHHTGGMGMGSMGVYLDDSLSGITVFGNIFWKVQRAAFVGGGRDNSIDNNLFIDCDPAVEIDGRGLDSKPVWHDQVYKTLKPRLLAMNHHEPPYSTRFPTLAQIDKYLETDKGVPPENDKVVHNVCVGKWIHIFWNAKPEMIDVHDNLVGKTPAEVGLPDTDFAASGFALRSDSAAWKVGFKPIPFAQIGPHKDAYGSPVRGD